MKPSVTKQKAMLELECNNKCDSCNSSLKEFSESECLKNYSGSGISFKIETVKSPKSQTEKKKTFLFFNFSIFQIIFIFAIGFFSAILLVFIAVVIIWCRQPSKNDDKRIVKYWKRAKELLRKLWRVNIDKLKKFIMSHLGFRFSQLRADTEVLIMEDIIQNLLLLINGVCSMIFAVQWNSPNNPLFLFSTKVNLKNERFLSEVLEMSRLLEFGNNINNLTYHINTINSVVAFLIVVLWCCTKKGLRNFWTKIRIASSISMLTTNLFTIAYISFSIYFDDLIQLSKNSDHFIMSNTKMQHISEDVLKVTLSGYSLTVMGFTITFLFHGVGGGLYTGTILYRILHSSSKKEKLDLETLIALIIILTIIQPFICLHPVIIWSQDSNHSTKYLLQTICIWFLPLFFHILMRLVARQLTKSLIFHKKKKLAADVKKKTPANRSKMADRTTGYRQVLGKIPSIVNLELGTSSQNTDKKQQKERSLHWKNLNGKLNVGIQVIELFLFIMTFSLLTDNIITTELDLKKKNLKKFVCPAIISMFMWMLNISYFLQDIALNTNYNKMPLIFRDKDNKVSFQLY